MHTCMHAYDSPFRPLAPSTVHRYICLLIPCIVPSTQPALPHPVLVKHLCLLVGLTTQAQDAAEEGRERVSRALSRTQSPSVPVLDHHAASAVAVLTITMSTTGVGQPPAGWSVSQEMKKIGGVDQSVTHFVTRTGKRVSTMNEVHSHLKVRAALLVPVTL